MAGFLNGALLVLACVAGVVPCLVLVFATGITRRAPRLSSRPTDTKETRNA